MTHGDERPNAASSASSYIGDALEYTLCGIDYGKVEEEEREFRARRRDERKERAFEWLRNAKAIFIEQSRLPLAGASAGS
jgi:hypothetical protein